MLVGAQHAAPLLGDQVDPGFGLTSGSDHFHTGEPIQPLRLNPILNTDSYKLSHWWQYPPNTRFIYSYVCSRGGFFDRAEMAGLQWKSLYAKYGGVLPLRIKAVKEGSVLAAQNALITIENTDPEFYWLTNWAETVLLQVWYPITVATLSRGIKQIIG